MASYNAIACDLGRDALLEVMCERFEADYIDEIDSRSLQLVKATVERGDYDRGSGAISVAIWELWYAMSFLAGALEKLAEISYEPRGEGELLAGSERMLNRAIFALRRQRSSEMIDDGPHCDCELGHDGEAS